MSRQATMNAACPECGGEGYKVRVVGSYRGGNGVIEAIEEEQECDVCDGTGHEHGASEVEG